jgi:hypothetical protein
MFPEHRLFRGTTVCWLEMTRSVGVRAYGPAHGTVGVRISRGRNQVTATEEQLNDSEEWADQSAPNLAATRWLANTLRSHQDPADPMPYSRQIFDGLQSNLAQITGALASANSTRDLSHLDAQAPAVDSALHQVATLPPVANRDPARQASRTFVEYREALR